jgi:hypothetical protein
MKGQHHIVIPEKGRIEQIYRQGANLFYFRTIAMQLLKSGGQINTVPQSIFYSVLPCEFPMKKSRLFHQTCNENHPILISIRLIIRQTYNENPPILIPVFINNQIKNNDKPIQLGS